MIKNLISMFQSYIDQKNEQKNVNINNRLNATPTATFDYASPQVIYANSFTDAEFYHYYSPAMKQLTCLGCLGYKENSGKFSKADQIADPKDDMYALGICILQLINGTGIRFFQDISDNSNWIKKTADKLNNPPVNIYSQLLATNRCDRPSAEELLHLIEKKAIRKGTYI